MAWRYEFVVYRGPGVFLGSAFNVRPLWEGVSGVFLATRRSPRNSSIAARGLKR